MAYYTIRSSRPGDEKAILALHNRAFSSHEERTRVHWNWKYHDNPLGRTEIMVAMEEGGRCVGAYAGVTHAAVLDGKPCLAGNHIDVAVDPELRSGIGGARLVTELGRRYFAAYAGGDTRMTWGFPEPSLHRLGLRLIKFEVLRDVIFLARPPDPLPSPRAEVSVDGVESFGEDVDTLWSRCRAEIGTGLVRDARYLNWRYARHPDCNHLLLEGRDASDRTLRGVAALREGGWDDAVLSMMDWLVPLDDLAVEQALIRQALIETARRGKRYLVCWFPAAQARFHRFQVEHGFFAQATPYQECFRAFTRGLDRRWLDRHWYQTMGDIDFF